MVVPEIKLMQIPAQMRFADVVIGAVNAAFQDREEAFDAVRMHIAPDVFFGGMKDCLMLSKTPAEAAVDVRFIGMKPRLLRNRTHDDRADRRRCDVRDVV